jgi:hypothetical protein
MSQHDSRITNALTRAKDEIERLATENRKLREGLAAVLDKSSDRIERLLALTKAKDEIERLATENRKLREGLAAVLDKSSDRIERLLAEIERLRKTEMTMRGRLRQLFCFHDWKEVRRSDRYSLLVTLTNYDDGSRLRRAFYQCRKCKKCNAEERFISGSLKSEDVNW